MRRIRFPAVKMRMFRTHTMSIHNIIGRFILLAGNAVGWLAPSRCRNYVPNN